MVDEILIGLSADIDCEKEDEKEKGGYTESIQDIREDIKNIK